VDGRPVDASRTADGRLVFDTMPGVRYAIKGVIPCNE